MKASDLRVTQPANAGASASGSVADGSTVVMEAPEPAETVVVVVGAQGTYVIEIDPSPPF